MKCKNLSIFIVTIALFTTSCTQPKLNTSGKSQADDRSMKTSKTDETFKQKHPLATYPKSLIQAGKVTGKTDDHLRKYAELVLKSPNDKMIQAFSKKYGDFGIPAVLPDKKLQDFLSYSSDHIRVPYLHIGKENSYRKLRFTWHAYALRDLWLYHDNEVAREKYIIMLKHALRNLDNLTDKELAAKIDKTGLKNLWHPLMKSAALYYAQLYEASGNEAYAKRSILILKRFGEVFDSWPIHFQRNSHDKRDRGSRPVNGPLPINTYYGLWGFWGDTHDLPAAKYLLDAYLLIKNSSSFKNMTLANQNIIIQDLLYKIVKKHTYFKLRPLHNQNMNRIKGMLYFGLKLKRADYIHIGIRWLNDILHISYRRDGLWCEGTASYGFPITKELIGIAASLKGYSDPKGYIDAVDGTHISNFDPEKEFGYNFKRMKKAFNKLVLPNGNSMAYEDSTWNFKNLHFDSPPEKTTPFLLGASGIGMLGFGKADKQTRLYLHWEGTNGHDHYDCLGLTLWANNEEIISETAYRGNRNWQISTAAHNTVVINEQNQSKFNLSPQAKKKSDKLYLYPQYEFGDLWWGPAACFDDGGNLTMWNSTLDNIQVMEVDGKNCYAFLKNVKTYKRTLALIKCDDKNFYIIDIFRVKGGKIHDWMLHGNLTKKYKIKLQNLILNSKKGQVGKYLNNIRQAESDKMVTAKFQEPGSHSVLQTTILGAPGTSIMVLDGPAMRLQAEPSCWGQPGRAPAHELPTKGKSEFLCVRRNGEENVFIAIHQVYTTSAPVKKIIPISKTGTVKLKVEMADRVDTLEFTEDSSMSIIQQKKTGRSKMTSFGKNPLTGDVVAVSSKDRGAAHNSFTVNGRLPYDSTLTGEVILIKDGDGRIHPYLIDHIKPLGNKQSVIYIKSETGMLLKKKLMVMTFYPSWDIAGQLTYTIPGKAVENN